MKEVQKNDVGAGDNRRVDVRFLNLCFTESGKILT
jgi:hypothetical protein